MGRKRKQLLAVAASAAVAIGLAGCGGDNTAGQSSKKQAPSTVVKGGELHYEVNGVIDHLDPQRVYTGRDLANFAKIYARSLVAFPTGIDVTDSDPDNKALTPVPDLATDTGTHNDDATQWMFTLKDGVSWEDGSPVTCADLKYGLSRVFAVDIITGGPNYALGYIDAPDYKGPYEPNAKGQAEFDKAVTCSDDNKTITYNFKKPWPDFALNLASLASFDPYKQTEDKGDKSNYTVFSDGPYKLDGAWDPDKGGTFVRNENYDASTDEGVRNANPDSIVFQLGFDPTAGTAIKGLIADKDPDAILASSITPDQYPKITGDVADRAVNIKSPFTNYLLPNFNQVTNVKVRQALALATNRAAYSQALGQFASTPADSIVNPEVPGYEPVDAFSKTEGDPEGAKALLKEAGVPTPFPIKLTYPTGSDAANQAFAALKDSYDKAGFTVTLDGLDPQGPYYPTIQNPGSDSDLIWGGWGADWPSIGTVIPPLFDSRLNLTSKTSNGQDYGNYDSDAANNLMDQAGSQVDLDKANGLYAQLNQKLVDDVAYIPLDTTQFYYLRGSNIENYVNGVGTSGYPDLGTISLANGGK